MENILFTILYKLLLSSKRDENISMHSFNIDKNIDSFPKYKIALQALLTELRSEIHNYIFIAIQADCLNNRQIKIFNLLDDSK